MLRGQGFKYLDSQLSYQKCEFTELDSVIGLFGGTFDPIHNGHLSVMEKIFKEIDMEEIFVVPAGNPYMKTEISTSADERFKMVELALENEARLSISDMEIKRFGPSYTLDTFKAIQLIRPGEEVVVIMGLDAVLTIPKWDYPKEFINSCKIIAITRENIKVTEIAKLSGQYKNADILLLTIETPNISSTEIRECILQGREFRHMLPEKVADYIVEHNLYL